MAKLNNTQNTSAIVFRDIRLQLIRISSSFPAALCIIWTLTNIKRTLNTHLYWHSYQCDTDGWQNILQHATDLAILCIQCRYLHYVAQMLDQSESLDKPRKTHIATSACWACMHKTVDWETGTFKPLKCKLEPHFLNTRAQALQLYHNNFVRYNFV